MATGAMFMAAYNVQPVEAVTDTMYAVIEWFAALPTLGTEPDTWENLLLYL